MKKLENQQYELVMKYITKHSSIYFINVLNNQSDGIVWADCSKDPKTVVVFSEYQEGFQIMGQALDSSKWMEFKAWFEQDIVPFLKSKNMTTFEYGVDNAELGDMMKHIFSEKQIGSEKQKIFQCSSVIDDIPMPEGYQYEKIDENFFQKTYSNMSYIIEEVEMACVTWKRYLEHGYGYAAIQNNEIAARALMMFDYKTIANISVDTLSNHRRKGLSAYLASLTMKETICRHQNPIWDCSEDNIASEKTALKCGFQHVFEEDVFWFDI